MSKYPCVRVNLDAVRQNAATVCGAWRRHGVLVAGVVKFSDADPMVAGAYLDGGCAQLAVSRAVHLEKLKNHFPTAPTLLTRAPMRDELSLVARYADISLHSDADILRALDAAAEEAGTAPGVILMLDVGDLREGVDSIDALVSLAAIVEGELPHLHLLGVGANYACLNGVLPTYDNLSFLVEGAQAVERAIGRRLEIISGGSSINMLLLQNGECGMPPRINHLRVGGFIANPINMRIGRGYTLSGMREDSIELVAEIVEIQEKDSVPRGSSACNWAGEAVTWVDKGRRKRAILAIGGQDIGDFSLLMSKEPCVELVGGSSDHTVVDVTDSPREWHTGDTMRFRLKYAGMLHAFSGRHVRIEYIGDKS